MTLRARAVTFGACCAAIAVAHRPLLEALYAHARSDESASHVVLIPLVALVLIVQNRASIFASVGYDWSRGLALGAAGAALLAGARWVEPQNALTAGVLGVVALWLASFATLFGREAFRAARFPLLFLAFTAPIPPVLLDQGVWLLKRGSAEAVAALFAITGTPNFREGFVFALPTVTIEVADECSGIRSSIALLLTSVLAGYQFLGSARARLLLVLCVLPITILKNGIRIVSLSLLAIHVDPGFLVGRLHHDGGVAFFLLALHFQGKHS